MTTMLGTGFVVVVIFGMMSGCTPAGPSANDIAAQDALDKWWKSFIYAEPPERPGTVRPAHVITSKTGRITKLPKHVQTKKEFDDEAKDAQYMEKNQALIHGFSVKGNTVSALTNLTRTSVDILDHDIPSESDAQGLCHEVSSFVWAKPNAHFRLDNIEIIGAQGEVLSSRSGLRGACVRP